MQTIVQKNQKEKINFYLSKDIARKTNLIAKENNSTVSEIIRLALIHFIDEFEKKKMEAELIEAYKAYYDLDKKIASEWRNTETRS